MRAYIKFVPYICTEDQVKIGKVMSAELFE